MRAPWTSLMLLRKIRGRLDMMLIGFTRLHAIEGQQTDEHLGVEPSGLIISS
jgi:hypothetical protein